MPVDPGYAPPSVREKKNVSMQYQHLFLYRALCEPVVLMTPETMVDDADDSPAGVEIFGCLQLIKSTTNGSGYKDVYHRKHLKKKPFQAIIYRKSHKDHINLGTFEKAKEAAVAVAEARLSGIEKLQSPDKSRLERGSGGELISRTSLCACERFMSHRSLRSFLLPSSQGSVS